MPPGMGAAAVLAYAVGTQNWNVCWASFRRGAAGGVIRCL